MNLLRNGIAIIVLTLALSQTVFAIDQEVSSDQAARDTAFTELKEKIEGISGDLFLREQTLESGVKLIQVIWEADGQTSKIIVELRPLGQYESKPVFGLFAYCVVEQVESGSLPPAVIKAVATKNETAVLGFYSMPESFDTVYINMTTPSDTLTSGQLWMIFAWLHKNRIEFKGEVDSILKSNA